MVTVTAQEAYRDELAPTRRWGNGVPRWYEAGEVPRGPQDMPDVSIRLDVSFVSRYLESPPLS